MSFLNRIVHAFAGRRNDSPLPVDAARSRILSGEWIPAESSNIREYRYFKDTERLEVNFHNGSLYAISGVRPFDAVSFDLAPSKGTWYWDNIRVRGKGNARKTQKPFGRIA